MDESYALLNTCWIYIMGYYSAHTGMNNLSIKLWKIHPATIEARNKLLESGIMFKKHKISLLNRDLFVTDKIPSEK